MSAPGGSEAAVDLGLPHGRVWKQEDQQLVDGCAASLHTRPGAHRAGRAGGGVARLRCNSQALRVGARQLRRATEGASCIGPRRTGCDKHA